MKKRLRKVVMAGVVLCAVSLALAAGSPQRLYTWVGGSGGYWFDHTQWDCEAQSPYFCAVWTYPNDDTDAALFMGNGDIDVYVDTDTIDESINRLRIKHAAGGEEENYLNVIVHSYDTADELTCTELRIGSQTGETILTVVNGTRVKTD